MGSTVCNLKKLDLAATVDGSISEMTDPKKNITARILSLNIAFYLRFCL